MSFNNNFFMNKSERQDHLMITSNFSYKESLRHDLTIDLNLRRGDPSASIKYVSNQIQLNLVSIALIFQLFFPLYCFYNSCRSVYTDT